MNVNFIHLLFVSCLAGTCQNLGLPHLLPGLGSGGASCVFFGTEKIMKKLKSLIGESPEEGENLAPECGLHVPLASEEDKLKKNKSLVMKNLGKGSVPRKMFTSYRS